MRDDALRIDSLQTYAIPGLQKARDDALAGEQTAITAQLEAERRWSPLRRVVTAVSCLTAGAAAVDRSWVAAGAAAAVCGGSLALP